MPYGLTLDQNNAVRPRRSSAVSFCRGHDPLDAARGLDTVTAAPYEQGLAQPVLDQLDRADLVREPDGQPFLVRAGRGRTCSRPGPSHCSLVSSTPPRLPGTTPAA